MRCTRLALFGALLIACGKTESGDTADAGAGAAGSAGGTSGAAGTLAGGSGGTASGGAAGVVGGGIGGVSGASGAGNAPALELLPACIEYRNATDSVEAKCGACIAEAETSACSAHFKAFFESDACKAPRDCLSGCLFCQHSPCGSGTCSCEAACAGCGPPECSDALAAWYMCSTKICSSSCRDCKTFGSSCSDNKDCCSMRCVGDLCAEGLPAPCLDGGAACSLGDQCCSRTCINDTCTPLPCTSGG